MLALRSPWRRPSLCALAWPTSRAAKTTDRAVAACAFGHASIVLLLARAILASLDHAALEAAVRYVDPNDSSPELSFRSALRGVFSIKYALWWAWSQLARGKFSCGRALRLTGCCHLVNRVPAHSGGCTPSSYVLHGSIQCRVAWRRLLPTRIRSPLLSRCFRILCRSDPIRSPDRIVGMVP